MRGSADFDDLIAYRRFIDEIVSRKNARNAKRIDANAPRSQSLPEPPHFGLRGDDRHVTSSGGFTLRKVFYTVPSRLIGHRLRVRLYDDRLDLFIGGTQLMTLARGRPLPTGKHAHVVDYRHVIHALRRKPMALLNLVYRDQLFPRDAYRRTFDRLLEKLPDRTGLPDHGRSAGPGARARLRGRTRRSLTADLAPGQLPDMAALRTLRAGSRRTCRGCRPSRAADAYEASRLCRDGRRCMTQSIDSARLTLILNELRLPAIKQDWAAVRRASRQGRLARRTLPHHARRARDRRTRPPAPRAPSRRGAVCCPERPSTASTSTPCR